MTQEDILYKTSTCFPAKWASKIRNRRSLFPLLTPKGSRQSMTSLNRKICIFPNVAGGNSISWYKTRPSFYSSRSVDDKEHCVYIWDESTRLHGKKKLPFKLPGWIVADTLDFLRDQVKLGESFIW